MLYKVENYQVKFMDIKSLYVYSIDLPKICRIDYVTINKSRTLIAFTASDVEGKRKGIFLFNLNNGDLQTIYNKEAYDLLFDNSQERLFFNSGNAINYIDLQTGMVSKLYKFSRITYAPISLCQNPEGTHISYHKWKSDKKRLYIYNLLNDIENDMGISFYRYSWLDNQRIIYSLNGGLSILDIVTKKSERKIKNAKSLIKQYLDKDNQDNEIKVFKNIDLVVDDIGMPVVCDMNMYFEVFLTTNDKKHIGIYSIVEDKTDLQCHFSSNQGLIRNYGVLSDGETIYVEIEPNDLLNETIDAGIVYIKNNIMIDYNGWIPVNGSCVPSTF